MNLQAKLLNCPESVDEMKRYVQQWHELNINEIYLLSHQIERAHVREAINHFNGKIWVVIQTLLAPNVNYFPLAITNEGRDAIATGNGSWLRMLCPRGKNQHGESILSYRKKQIQKLIRDHAPEGISLDFIRHFVFWEAVTPNTSKEELPRSCFCSTCREQFSAQYDIEIPHSDDKAAAEWILNNHQSKWDKFSRDTITEMVKELVEAARNENDAIQTNIHLIPWKQNEFAGARATHAGQDLKELAAIIDRVSPMCYAPMLQRPFSWAAELSLDIHNESSLPIWPAIQACSMYGTESLSDEEFKAMVQEAGKAPAAGAVIWPWETITDQQLRLLKSFAS